ncbi:SMP-30/gluconolactonase/LRE family protein [Actinokineospora bangkokensis]|uniref:SMP-30/gluconolactonase/LRE family protein n=1 Tax=Actinokineospora bangkokensis TaxID=1193682 RepID=UPI001E60DE6C|nr:SMP-30/gluconolactonase/LRE family protein [Actinokineospora bangkokensis]
MALHPLPGAGAEDVLVDPADGSALTGLDDGRVVRVTEDGKQITEIADTGGRPLGLEWHPDGGLVVCDASRGLLRVGLDGSVAELVARGRSGLRLCNNAAVAADGTVYFSDSTSRFDLPDYRADVIEHSATGRLLRRTLDGAVDVLVTGLAFANGVALAPDESAVFVSDMAAYNIRRVSLPDGAVSVFADDLPGFADNLSLGSDGLVWMAFPSPRDPVLDTLLATPPAIRKALWRLPEKLQPNPDQITWVRAIDPTTAAVVHDLRAPLGTYPMVTGVREHGGRVWLGGLTARALGSFSLPGPGARG